MARAYGSIPHLPGSRTGSADRTVSAGQARLCTVPPGDSRDEVIVQEKLDGSCVAALRDGDRIVALGRGGDEAARSPNPARRLWAAFVGDHADRFRAVLEPGERLVGEWLALAHGTRYVLRHEPFVCFDLMRGTDRLPLDALAARVGEGFVLPGLVHRGAPLDPEAALGRLGAGFHGAIDPVEGAVWRLERTEAGATRVIVVAKYVRASKVDGALLPENSGAAPIWNWHPDR